MLSLLLFSGCKKPSPTYKVNLEIWGVFDSNDAYSEIISEYRRINPFIGDIRYKKFTVDNYEKDLLSALASGQGPDIFMIQNTWLPSFKDKIELAPGQITNEREFRDNFADVAISDFLDEGKIYAVPLSVDSLALYYNKDLFNAEGITSPPATWDEFNEDVKKLTKIDQNGNITQAGAAIGTAYNINRSTDILGLLMLQNGVPMVDEKKTGTKFEEGEKAWEYYTQFARSGSSVYTWNPTMHYSLDAFYEGTLAMMFNYSWHYTTIQSKNSKLNFDVASVPQLSSGTPANYANYWGFAVSKNKITQASSQPSNSNEVIPDNKLRIHEAWQFLKFLAMKNGGNSSLMNGISGNVKEIPLTLDPAKTYLEKTKKPAARRDLIEEQKKDPVLGIFAAGNLIAKSWYQVEPKAIEAILAEAIDAINKGSLPIHEALNTASERINQLMRE